MPTIPRGSRIGKSSPVPVGCPSDRYYSGTTVSPRLSRAFQVIVFRTEINFCHFHHRVYNELTMACSPVGFDRALRPGIANVRVRFLVKPEVFQVLFNRLRVAYSTARIISTFVSLYESFHVQFTSIQKDTWLTQLYSRILHTIMFCPRQHSMSNYLKSCNLVLVTVCLI